MAHLLGHEGEGSVIAHLKQVGFASYLFAGCDTDSNFDNNSLFSLFRIAITLTSKGLGNWPYVVDTVIRYIRMAMEEGPQEWIYSEIKNLAALDYDYLDEGEEEDLAERLCVEMCPLLERKRKELLPSTFLYYDFDPDAINAFLELLQPSNMLVTLSSSTYKGNVSQVNVEGEEEEGEGEWESDDDEEGSKGEGEEDDPQESGEEGEELTAATLTELYTGPAEWAYLGLPPTDSTGSETEPHFGTTFWTEPLPASLLARWRASYSTTTTTTTADAFSADFDTYAKLASDGPALSLPSRNEYIPEDLDIVPPLTKEEAARRGNSSSFESAWKLQMQIPLMKVEGESGGQSGKKHGGKTKKKKLLEVPKDPEPLRILNIPGLRVWHLVDPRFPIPKASLFLRLTTPLPNSSARNAAMTDVLKHVLYDSLEKTIYTAALASLDTNFASTDLGLDMKFRGFSHKLPQLVDTVLKRLSNLSSFVTESSFTMQTEKLRRIYRNDGLKASSVVNSARLRALKENTHSSKAKLEQAFTFKTSEVRRCLLSRWCVRRSYLPRQY